MHTLDRNSAHTVRQNVIAPAALLRSASGHPAHAQASSPGVSEIPVLPGICADEDKKLRETGAFCRMRERGVLQVEGPYTVPKIEAEASAPGWVLKVRG